MTDLPPDPEAPISHFGAAVRPSRLARLGQLGRATRDLAASPMAERFHRESSLVQTHVATRRDPVTMAAGGAGLFVRQIAEPVYAIEDEPPVEPEGPGGEGGD